MRVLSDLAAGDYVISETTTMDAVSFIINGEWKWTAVSSMAGTSNTVQISIHRRSGRAVYSWINIHAPQSESGVRLMRILFEFIFISHDRGTMRSYIES